MNLTLRAWQRAALSKWYESSRRGVAEVVTGGGKTVFALTAIQEHLRGNVQAKVRVVVPTIALLDQWIDEIVAHGVAPEDEVGAIVGGRRRHPKARVEVGVVNSLRSGVSVDAGTLLVADEVHRYGSMANARALSGAFTATLGLSATPESEYDARFDEVLIPLVGPIIFRYGLAEALRDEILTPFRVVNTRVPFLESEGLRYDEITRRVGRAVALHGRDSDNVRVLLRKRARVTALAALRVPTAIRLVEEHRGKRAIVFHESISHANAIAKALRSRGLSVTVYHSGLGSALRRDNLRQFRRGLYDVLVTCRSLDEGLDAPEIEVAVIAAATATARQRLQRIGRVLRRAKNKAEATIHTIYSTDPEESRLRGEVLALGDLVRGVRWRRLASANE